MTSPLLQRASALASTLPQHRASHDANKQLDRDVVAMLREQGMFGALVPRELGGEELSPRDYVLLLETLAAGDSATAWCVMTASTSTLLAPYLSRDTAGQLWSSGRPAPFLAGIFAPMGKVTTSDTSARLTGRWSWASGSRHADWFVVGALHDRRHVVAFLPPSSVEVVDNWDTLGLAGTGSHDLKITDAEVPLPYLTSVFDRAPWSDAALYRVPLFGLLAVGVASCALGVARAALDIAGATLTADSSSAVWSRFAELRGALDAARAYLLSTAEQAYAAAASGAVTPAVRGALRLAACHVAAACTDVAHGAFHLGGGASVRAGSPLGNALRDLETIRTHKMVTDRVRPAAARAMSGVGSAPPDL